MNCLPPPVLSPCLRSLSPICLLLSLTLSPFYRFAIRFQSTPEFVCCHLPWTVSLLRTLVHMGVCWHPRPICLLFMSTNPTVLILSFTFICLLRTVQHFSPLISCFVSLLQSLVHLAVSCSCLLSVYTSSCLSVCLLFTLSRCLPVTCSGGFGALDSSWKW